MNILLSSRAGAALVLLWSVGPLAAQTAIPSTVVTRRTLLQELNLPAIWFLVGCSLLVVWLVMDIWIRSAPGRMMPEADVGAIRGLFSRGDYQGAFDHARSRTGLFNEVVQAALRHVAAGVHPCEDARAAALAGGVAWFQGRIAYLSVIGVIAPMVGLTGTVLGMIDAFALMGQAGAADPSRLSGAIGHVLHATAGGLIVAIPAFVAYYLLRNRVHHAMQTVAGVTTELFRQFPFEAMADRTLRGAEACAAVPVWAEERPAATVDAR